MPYENNETYAKYQNKAGCAESGSGCEGCADCKENEDCSCCPPGLVAVYNAEGTHMGCLTPADAELFQKAIPCQAGYVKLYQGTPETGTFLGCVPSDEFAALYAAVNPGV